MKEKHNVIPSQPLTYRVSEDKSTMIIHTYDGSLRGFEDIALRRSLHYLENAPTIHHLVLARPIRLPQLYTILSQIKKTQITEITFAERYDATTLQQFYALSCLDTQIQSYQIITNKRWKEGGQKISARERFVALGERNRAQASTQIVSIATMQEDTCQAPVSESEPSIALAPESTASDESSEAVKNWWQKFWEELVSLWQRWIKHPRAAPQESPQQIQARKEWKELLEFALKELEQPVLPPLTPEERKLAFWCQDYCRVLDVVPLASQRVIASQARKLHFKFAPDKHPEWTPEEREQGQLQFNMISEAHQALLDCKSGHSKMRAQWELDNLHRDLLNQIREKDIQLAELEKQRSAEQAQAEQREQPESQFVTDRLVRGAVRKVSSYFFPSVKKSAPYSSLASDSVSEGLEETTESDSLLASSDIQQKI